MAALAAATRGSQQGTMANIGRGRGSGMLWSVWGGHIILSSSPQGTCQYLQFSGGSFRETREELSETAGRLYTLPLRQRRHVQWCSKGWVWTFTAALSQGQGGIITGPLPRFCVQGHLG